MQRGVDYIEGKLDEDVALSAVAAAAGISQWHFQRLFKALTGETLKTYIRSRRLAASLERLLGTELRVLDIAVLAGFESQEAFARAFKQAFGLTPQKYRGLRDKSLFLKKPRFDQQYLQQLSRNDALTPRALRAAGAALGRLAYAFLQRGLREEQHRRAAAPLWGAFVARLSEIPNGACPAFATASCAKKRPTASASSTTPPSPSRASSATRGHGLGRGSGRHLRSLRAPRSGSAHRPHRELRLRQLARPVQTTATATRPTWRSTAPRITRPTTTRSFTTRFRSRPLSRRTGAPAGWRAFGVG